MRETLATVDPETCYNSFTSLLNRAIASCTQTTTPQATNRKFKKIKPWITHGLVVSFRKKEKLARKVKLEPFNTQLQTYFQSYRSKYKHLINQSKKIYVRRKLDSANGNMSKTWTVINEFIKGQTKSKIQIEKLVSGPGGENISGLDNCAEAMDIHYANVGRKYFGKTKLHIT